MEMEARVITDTARGRDGREGIAAFLEKRDPRFTGAKEAGGQERGAGQSKAARTMRLSTSPSRLGSMPLS